MNFWSDWLLNCLCVLGGNRHEHHRQWPCCLFRLRFQKELASLRNTYGHVMPLGYIEIVLSKHV